MLGPKGREFKAWKAGFGRLLGPLPEFDVASLQPQPVFVAVGSREVDRYRDLDRVEGDLGRGFLSVFADELDGGRFAVDGYLSRNLAALRVAPGGVGQGDRPRNSLAVGVGKGLLEFLGVLSLLVDQL